MASRMDRYSNSKVPSGRSDRNKSLYKQIEDMDSYTNIAGIATIDNKNEIDLEKVKAMFKRKDVKNKALENNKDLKNEEQTYMEEEIKNYDINDLLSKVKEKELNVEVRYRSLSEKQKDFLKSLNNRNEELKNEELEIEELMNTITKMDNLKSKDDPDDVGLLDDLKSDTMVGDASSIKKIIEEEKELTKEFDTMQLDKSFYTSSFGFTQKDFEELKDMNQKIKKDNKFIIILLVILIILIIAGVVFFVVK